MNKTLSDLITEFLEYKKQNGYVYTTAEYHLNKYIDFASSHVPLESIPSRKTVNAFLNRYSGTPGNLYNAAAALREFSRYLIGLGYASAYVIPAGKISLPIPVRPYLFTEDEITKFFTACDSIPYDCHVPKRHLVLPAMYKLLYCCGLRCKEIRTLRRELVHPETNYIDIVQSKGPKNRRLFISHELSEYLSVYDTKMDHIFPDRIFFFPSREDAPYGASAFQKNFLKIWYTAFPEKLGNGVSIRAYDFRHHFAYANMNRWLKEGKDVNVMLPYLMRYMGHQDIEHTLYYFHLVPDIYHTIVEKASLFEDLLPEVSEHA
ncbi:tyrosine-type recombinase/integrase [Murimonas intestini]|uniref:Site-specific recombinase XerD n=1 Tax=Murimonas intestini TaxID=1337051 RepID=A0AB73SXA3_9FIRM|nr:tyrosine-type recombinase/integrase [Murimonas intestini]MCR1843484.1 tyrosine-type recombinase/integrase [Murimonas intestini]MCR1868817.1 tyrosine-type recombinase/integrase [Murimonas intestini]MCR1886411.1 tyrosine-type recombinase/integrase [Murimonas intestini]